jgi:hypothetical protein
MIKTPEEMDKDMDKLGVFTLLSSDKMGSNEIPPLYFTRQQIEQVFDTGKNYAGLIPIRTHKEETLRGHLMLTFMAAAILQRLQRDIISKREKNDKTNPEGVFMNLRNQKRRVYSTNIIPQEPVKTVNAVYKLLGIECPTTINRSENVLCYIFPGTIVYTFSDRGFLSFRPVKLRQFLPIINSGCTRTTVNSGAAPGVSRRVMRSDQKKSAVRDRSE